MAGRGRAPAHILRLQDPQPPLLGRAPPPHSVLLIEDPRAIPLHLPDLPPRGLPPHPALILEERLAAQHREIQALLLDNQRLAATHVALKQEVNATQHELRLAAAAAAKAKADRDAELREMYERSIKMENEVRSVDGMRAELAQVRLDAQKLGMAREELVDRLQGLKGDLARAKADLGKVPALKAEIENMHLEIQRGRAAVEYEKKAHADNLEVSQAMEKNMISMAREVEKLRAELANSEKRARAAAAAAAPGPGYVGNYGNPEMSYSGNSYPDVYGMHQISKIVVKKMQFIQGDSSCMGVRRDPRDDMTSGERGWLLERKESWRSKMLEILHCLSCVNGCEGWGHGMTGFRHKLLGRYRRKVWGMDIPPLL